MKQRVAFTSRGNTVRGWAHSPQTSRLAPVVVMCHGFTGNCSEHGLFDDFARQACDEGIYVLRIDCVGSGDSSGDFAKNTCLGGWKQDMIAAFDFAAEQPEVDGTRLATVGISMGAGAALLTLSDQRVLAAVGWAPVLYPDEVFRKIMGPINWEKLGQGQQVHHEYASVEFDVCPCLRRDAEQLSVEQMLHCDKPVLLRFGTEDSVIDQNTASRITGRSLSNIEVQMVEGENHSFMVHEQENISESLEFLCRCLM